VDHEWAGQCAVVSKERKAVGGQRTLANVKRSGLNRISLWKPNPVDEKGAFLQLNLLTRQTYDPFDDQLAARPGKHNVPDAARQRGRQPCAPPADRRG
jgi:hypothetical protein